MQHSKLKLIQPQDGYRYNSDSLLLYYFVAHFKPKGEMLDIGCGCGIVGLLLARDFKINLTGIDIQAQMQECAMDNAKNNSIKAFFINNSILDYDFKELKYDFIVSNPPFYPSCGTKSEYTNKKIARYKEFMPFDDLVKKINSIINPKSSFIFCYDASAFQEIISILKKYKWYIHTVQFVYPTELKNAHLVLIAAKKYQQGTAKILPPIYKNNKKFNDIITKKANTKSI